MKYNTLLVEDSEETQELVKVALENICQIEWVRTFSNASERVKNKVFDLILLDIGLPDGNGIDLCSEILKKSFKQSIIIISASRKLSEKVLGFCAGADDYITKPFNLTEFRCRVLTKLKKREERKNLTDLVSWSEIRILKSTQEVCVLENDLFVPVQLTNLEFRLLCLFSSNPNRILTRDEILDQIWGENIFVYSRSVDTHVSKLRKKLRSASHIIESLHGQGYRFSPSEK